MPDLDRRSRALFLRPRRALACGLASVVLMGGALVWAAAAPESPRPTMRMAFQALAGLMPIAFAASEDTWKAQATTVQKSIATLSAATDQLVAHGAQRDATFQFLSDSLNDQVRALRWQIVQGDFEGATMVTMRLVDTCVACHVRVPNTRGDDFAKTLLKGVDRESLAPFDRAALETAGRQFDAALKTYEEAFGAEDAPIDTAEFSEALEAYLIVALRVQRDPVRAERGLARLAQQPDRAAQFERNLATWRRALKDLAPALREPASLERARQVLDSGRLLSEFPLDGADEIHAVVASSIVFRFLEEKRPTGEELARTLYLLARTEAFSRPPFEISEAAFYLEQAIRAAPHTDIADRAYARLELQTILEYTSPFGLDIPEDVDAWLLELRELSGSAPPPPAKKSNNNASAEKVIG